MSKRVFKRKIYNKMLEWKTSRNGKSALLIKGARRVGKSTIVENFAKNEYESCIIVDFAKASKEIVEIFNDINDIDNVFMRLQFKYNTQLINRKSVIVFDEVQDCPKARQAIKYLVQDGRYDYIETGSLISIRKNTKNITIPSEETRLTMYPMDYEEFRWAMGDDATLDLMRGVFQDKTPLGDEVNRKLMRDLRLYMLVGGMPQAVNAYLDTKNLSDVDATKREILELYSDDFYKIDPTGKASRLFMAVPSQLSLNRNRFQPTTVVPGLKNDNLLELLFEMNESKTVNISYHANDPNVGMNLTSDESLFKMYVGDTGLMTTLAFWDKDITENIIYDRLLSDKLPVNLGYVYENLVAQMLTASGNKLFYYTFPDANKHYYEVDFLLSRGQKICPIEVKSSGYATHKSLDAFCEKFSSRIGERYLIFGKDLRKDGSTLMVPFYMAGLL